MLHPDVAKAVLDFKDDAIALDEFLFAKRYSLVPHQREIIRAIENHPFSFIGASRASAKTYTSARYLCSYCVRFPRTTAIISGPTYRQSKIAFRFAADILFQESYFDWDDFLTKEPTEGSDEAVITFRNGSRIIALPASGTKVHGKRGQVLLLTEFFEYPESLYAMTVLPFLAKREQGRDNKLIHETSAGFEFQFSHRVYKEFVQEVAKANPDYALLPIPLEVLLKEKWDIDMRIVNATRRIDEDTYHQQYNFRWLSDSGSFYILSLMKDEKLQTGEVTLKARPDREYVISLDTARSRRGKGDDSAIGVIEIGEKPEVVYLWSENNITADDLAKEVERRIQWFDGEHGGQVIALVIDTKGGGEYVMDPLARKGIISVDAEPNVMGRRLIVEFPNTPAAINQGHQGLRQAFESATIQMPAKPESEDPNVLLAAQEIDHALKQLADLETKILASGWRTFDAPGDRKKDKGYVLMYAHWGVQRILEERLATLQADLGDPIIHSTLGDVLISSENE